MKLRLLLATANCAFMFLLAAAAGNAAEVKLLSASVLRSALTELSGEFERGTGHKLIISYDSAGAVKKRIQEGESADVAILQKPALEALSKAGRVLQGSIVSLARSGVAVAVRQGTTKPDISTIDALKRSLLAAESIAYPDPAGGAAVGVLFRGVIERLGITQEVNAKAKIYKESSITYSEFVSQEKPEIALMQPMDILVTPNYDLAGWLPDELQDYNAFTWAVGVTANAKEPDAAKALIQFLSSPTAAAVIKKRGMQPTSP